MNVSHKLDKAAYAQRCWEHGRLALTWREAANEAARLASRYGRTPAVLERIAEIEGYRRQIERVNDKLREDGQKYRREPNFPHMRWPSRLSREIARDTQGRL